MRKRDNDRTNMPFKIFTLKGKRYAGNIPISTSHNSTICKIQNSTISSIQKQKNNEYTTIVNNIGLMTRKCSDMLRYFLMNRTNKMNINPAKNIVIIVSSHVTNTVMPEERNTSSLNPCVRNEFLSIFSRYGCWKIKWPPIKDLENPAITLMGVFIESGCQ